MVFGALGVVHSSIKRWRFLETACLSCVRGDLPDVVDSMHRFDFAVPLDMGTGDLNEMVR